MPTVTINQLWQGESGQASWQRRNGQVETMSNSRADISDGGVTKRGPSNFVRDLTEALASVDYFWTEIRGAIVAIAADVVLAWKEDGTVLPVIPIVIDNGTTGATALKKNNGDIPGVTTGNLDYLAGVTVADIDVTISNDTIIILNRKTTTSTITAFTPLQCYQYIIQDDTAASIVTGAVVDTFGDLPTAAVDRDLHYVSFGENQDPAGWYLHIATANQYPGVSAADQIFPPHGDWVRITNSDSTESDNAETRIDPLTMPHRLIFDEANNRMLWDVSPWKHRISGNTGSNRDIPIIGQNVRAVEFWSSRLFLIGNENNNASRRLDFFNLYVNSIEAIADDDRLSIDITRNDIGDVLGAAVIGNAIFIVAEKSQMQFIAPEGQVLTNINGIIQQITSFQADDTILGESNLMATIVDKFQDVHMYVWAEKTIIYGSRLTIHNQSILYDFTTARIHHFDQTIFISTASGTTITHDLFFSAGELIQSAWGRLDFFEGSVFFGGWDGNIRVITKDATLGHTLQTYIHRDEPPPEPTLQYVPRLDRMERKTSGDMTYSSANDETTISHTGRNASLTETKLFLPTHDWLAPVSVSGNDAVFAGDLTGNAFTYLGFKFRASVVLTDLWTAMSRAGIVANHMTAFVHETTDIAAKVTIDRSEVVFDQGKQFHAVNVTDVDAPSLDSSYLPFTLAGGDPRKMKIEFYSESLGPFTLTGIEYEAQTIGAGGS